MQKYPTFEVVVCYTQHASVFCVRCLWRGAAESRIQAIKTFGVSSPRAGNSHQNTSKSDKKWGMTRAKKQMAVTLTQQISISWQEWSPTHTRGLSYFCTNNISPKIIQYKLSSSNFTFPCKMSIQFPNYNITTSQQWHLFWVRRRVWGRQGAQIQKYYCL